MNNLNRVRANIMKETRKEKGISGKEYSSTSMKRIISVLKKILKKSIENI